MRNSNHCNKLPFEEFVNDSLTSLTWYDTLPGDKFFISGDLGPYVASDIAELLFKNGITGNENLIDCLAAKIINNCSSVHNYSRWAELSFYLSEVMSKNLTASGNRSLRMRAQRLIYYLQAIIDRNNEVDDLELVISERVLEGDKPWDFLTGINGDWWLSSGNTNIHYCQHNGTKKHWNIGLPTQIDVLPDGKLSIGSLYTNGALITDGNNWDCIAHDAPVILVFEYNNQKYFLDNNASLWNMTTGFIVKKQIRPQIHFARFFNNTVYILDNADFGHITTFVMETGELKRYKVLPVQVCNDIAMTNKSYYLIDKQQGSIFKFTLDWVFVKRVLLFGRCYGCLQDPVSVRVYNDCIRVVSWLTGRLTEIKFF